MASTWWDAYILPHWLSTDGTFIGRPALTDTELSIAGSDNFPCMVDSKEGIKNDANTYMTPNNPCKLGPEVECSSFGPSVTGITYCTAQ